MEQYIEQLKPLFADVAGKIGEGAEFGWTVVLKQQYVHATIGLFFAVLSVIGAIVLYKVLKKNWKKDGYSHDNDGLMALGIFGSILIFFMLIFGSIEAITHFINPEYYALEFFINLVK